MRGKQIYLSRLFLLSCMALGASPLVSEAGQARCFMHGIIVPKSDNKEKTSLSDMIRLHFDVSKPEDQGKCEKLMIAYCSEHVQKKSYSPGRLRGSFKPDVDKSEEVVYKFTEKCKLETED
jgi:hypothetical protein